MATVADIKAVYISLEIVGESALFILLAADGSINRMGTGAHGNTEKDLFIGMTEDPLFDQLMEKLSDEMLGHMGGYDVPEKDGSLCELKIGLSFASEEEDGFAFRYGSESQGPPHEIVELVLAAIELTEPWFEEQKQMANKD